MTGDSTQRTRSGSEHESSVVVVQSIIPDYRTPFFECLARELGPRLTILAGDVDWYPDVRHVGGVEYTPVRNVYFARRRLLWQTGTVRALVTADIAVLDVNPRIVSAWVVLLLRRLMRRKSVLWGHAWPRRGASSRTDRLRSAMRRLAGTVIVYTGEEARQLRARSPRLAVFEAPNALYTRAALASGNPAELPSDVIYVGRLTPSKRVDVLVDAFVLAMDELPPDVRLVLVGDGPLRSQLEARAHTEAMSDRVVFTGHVSSVDRLRELYGRSIVSVSPGYVGLALIQSLGFGVPMIVAESAPHGPEIEAAVPGENVVFFTPAGAAAPLSHAIVGGVRDRDRWLARRAEIASWTRARYTIDTMVESFVAALGLTDARDDAHAFAQRVDGQVGEAP